VVAVDRMTEQTEMGDLYHKISKNPKQFFVDQDIKGCFRRAKRPIAKSTGSITEATEENASLPSAGNEGLTE
jgi:hypothetical protein